MMASNTFDATESVSRKIEPVHLWRIGIQTEHKGKAEESQFFDTNQHQNGQQQQRILTEEEKAQIREELKKTEDEIETLRQVLLARQKHATDLKRKLGLSPWTEVTQDINQGLKSVRNTQAYQKTSEVVSQTADTVKHKWQDMRNSNVFKSFESKLGSAYNTARVAASTSIDHLAGHTSDATKQQPMGSNPNDDVKSPLS